MVTSTLNANTVELDVDGKFVNPEVATHYGMPSKESFAFTAHDLDQVFTPVVRAASLKSGARVSPYLSVGESHKVDGIEPVEPVVYSTCLHRVLASLGVKSPHSVCRVLDLDEATLLYLRGLSSYAKVHYRYTDDFHRDNHVSLVYSGMSSARLVLDSTNGALRDSKRFVPVTVGVTNIEQFFNSSNAFASIMFFSGNDGSTFGGDMSEAPVDPVVGVSGLTFGDRRGVRSGPRDPSVSDPASRSGVANVTSGVVRPKRRVIAAKSQFSPHAHVAKSYVSSSGVKFNNLNEMYLDSISRDYAQEILERLFAEWGVDSSDPDAAKYAEDLVFAFVVATTASNKADYDREFEIPHKSDTVTVNFTVFSRLLAEGFGVTRRQFARGVADDMRRYIREPENVHLRPKLAARIGCDPQMADLGFDGSTHCTNLTSAELSFTKLLEGRNLFEDDSLLAEGASQRLMQGMSSGPRSIISR